MGIDQQQRIVVLAKRCRADIAHQQRHALSDAFVRSVGQKIMAFGGKTHTEHCLLYTSDAADERSSVDLGGRRIIKKKNRKKET